MSTNHQSAEDSHKEQEEQALESAMLINPRSLRHCWTPEEARVFNQWDNDNDYDYE